MRYRWVKLNPIIQTVRFPSKYCIPGRRTSWLYLLLLLTLPDIESRYLLELRFAEAFKSETKLRIHPTKGLCPILHGSDLQDQVSENV